MFWGDWVLFSSHHIRGTRYQHDITVDVDLDYLADVKCTRFLDYLSFPLPFHTVLCGRTSLCATHTQVGSYVLLLEGGVSINVGEILLQGRFVCCPPLCTQSLII